MRLGSVAGVSAPADHLTGPYAVADMDADRAVPQVRDQRILAVPEVEDHMVAGRVLRVHVAGDVVGQPVHGLDDARCSGREHRPAERPVVGQLLAVAFVVPPFFQTRMSQAWRWSGAI